MANRFKVTPASYGEVDERPEEIAVKEPGSQAYFSLSEAEEEGCATVPILEYSREPNKYGECGGSARLYVT